MSIQDFDPDILNDFLTESNELLDELDADLVVLEDDASDPELLNRIFRALHTIKGSASFLAITNLVNFAHAAEDALNVIRKGEVQVDQAIMDALLRSVDILRQQLSSVDDSEEPEAGPQDLIDTLHKIANGEHISADSSGDNTQNNDSKLGATEQTAQIEPTEITETAPESNKADAPVASDDLELSPLSLSDSKADLIGFMVEDLLETLDKIECELEHVNDTAHRDEAVETIGELAESLARTAGFFEIEPMTGMVSMLEIASEHLDTMSDEALIQTLPRLGAVLWIIREQANYIDKNQIANRSSDDLRERLIDLLLGNGIEDDVMLSVDATVEIALQTDNVCSVFKVEDSQEDAVTEIEEIETSAVIEANIESANSTSVEVQTKEVASTTKPADKAAKQPRKARAEATIRVDVSRLESLLNLVGELVIQKNRVAAITRRVSHESIDSDLREEVLQAASDLDRVTGDIQVGVMKTRMQPMDKLFGKYPRLIRDLSRSTQKNIKLEIVGGDTEVDKSVLEELGDPLVHLLRNSADHGVELPEVRKEKGKTEEGIIRIIAEHQGSHVMVRIIDNGAGLNCDVIGRKAVEKGMVTQEELDAMSEREVMQLILGAGLSTAEQVSDLSGRGVGMDVVKTNIMKLGGTIDIDSVYGQGTTITIKIPLTVAILSAMMVSIENEMYAIPLTNIIEIVKPGDNKVSTINSQPVMTLRDKVLPLVNLAEQFDVKRENDNLPFAVVVESGEQHIGLLVSKLIGQQEIVIKPLDDEFDRDESISGATVRDDGGVSLILDVARIIENATAATRVAA